MKRLESLLDNIEEAIREAVEEALQKDESTAYATIETDCGYIEAAVTRKEKVNIYIFHDNKAEHDCPRLVEYIEHEFKDTYFWYDAKRELEEAYLDEYQRNGFASEADFWRWKEGV